MKTIPQFGQFGLMLIALLTAVTASTKADEVTDWNKNMLKAVHDANTSPLIATRVGAIVQASVFDAVNGIERRYTAVHVPPAAPPGASVRAAAVQAAYAALVKLYPAQQSTFDAELAASLAGISSGAAAEDSQAVDRGVQWGQAVADAIWAWRSTDGFTPAPPPFLGGTAVGQWRPTPPGNLPGAGPQFATMTPWAINSPSQFRPAGPPALDSAKYAADFNEVKDKGSLSSSTRTPDETVAANFWNSSSVTYYWNSVAVSLAAQRGKTLSENARLLAVLNISMADAVIACWDAKYTYVFWRPITAITLAATDGNPATIEDPLWAPLLVTPAHPDYPSGHSTASGAAAEVLATYFGDGTSFTVDSDFMPGVTRSFTSFSNSLEEIKTARVFAGIHFRTACDDGRDTGKAVADFVMANALQDSADEVLHWNVILQRSVAATPSAAGAPGFRMAAIVQASVFDAVNGIDQRFTPIHVTSQAPAGASRRAAAVQAAYTALIALFPAQSAVLDQELASSLARLAADDTETGAAIAHGRDWGKKVANEILVWRSTDGFDPSPSTYTGSLLPGKWRPTPPALANGLWPSLAHTLPWVITSPSSFRPAGPPDLTSAKYAADFNEEKTIGETNSTVRTADQTVAARFWQAAALTLWNRIAADTALQSHATLSENARLFALLNVAMADAGIACWDAKYFYELWRPITAIRLASTDGNPDTAEQADWAPLIITPAFPEYPSGHSAISGAAAAVLTRYFGNDIPAQGTAEGIPGVVRHWPSFSAAADEANDARVWGGIHFRSAVVDSRAMGEEVGAYVMANAAQDRQPGVILQHTDGSLALWTMHGTTIAEGIVSDTIPAGWQIVGAGDFNHDNQRDLVLQHTDGSVAFWLMQGTTITERVVLFAVPEGRRIVATGDFNNDNQVDLVLQDVNGLMAFWFMDGTSVIGTELSYQLPAGWRVAGTGRFDHDAATDLVLQHTDGSVAFWLLDGTTLVNGVLGDQIPNAWQIVATGNFNSDNDTDIVLQHTDGSVAFWLMDGTTIAEGVATYSVPAGWQIVGPR